MTTGADVLTVRQHLGACRDAVDAFQQHTGEVDAGHERRDRRDLTLRDRRQPILVVHTRPPNIDESTVGRQIIGRELDQATIDRVAIGDGPERTERFS